MATDHRILNLKLTNQGPPQPSQQSFLNQDQVNSQIKKLVLSRVNQMTRSTELQSLINSPEFKNLHKEDRKLIFGAIGDGLSSLAGGAGDLLGGAAGAVGDVVGGVGKALGGAVSGVGNLLTGGNSGSSNEENSEGEEESTNNGALGAGIGMAAAGAGLMKKKQREMEHRHALLRVENEMAASQFSADFQDQAIMELSRTVGTANYISGRLTTIMKNVDYSFGQLTNYFYQCLV